MRDGRTDGGARKCTNATEPARVLFHYYVAGEREEEEEEVVRRFGAEEEEEEGFDKYGDEVINSYVLLSRTATCNSFSWFLGRFSFRSFFILLLLLLLLLNSPFALLLFPPPSLSRRHRPRLRPCLSLYFLGQISTKKSGGGRREGGPPL